MRQSTAGTRSHAKRPHRMGPGRSRPGRCGAHCGEFLNGRGEAQGLVLHPAPQLLDVGRHQVVGQPGVCLDRAQHLPPRRHHRTQQSQNLPRLPQPCTLTQSSLFPYAPSLEAGEGLRGRATGRPCALASLSEEPERACSLQASSLRPIGLCGSPPQCQDEAQLTLYLAHCAATSCV